MIAIVDYGVGNLFSLQSSLISIGADTIVTGDAAQLRAADKIILPGVGAFGDAAAKLRENGLDEVVVEQAKVGKPLLGICLGMQLLFERGFEFGEHAGLGLIPGNIRSIAAIVPSDYKIPHIGWNALQFTSRASALYKFLQDDECVYFVHSYYATDCKPYVTANAEYGALLTASAENENVFGTQFHPEKSGAAGLKILRAFCEMES